MESENEIVPVSQQKNKPYHYGFGGWLIVYAITLFFQFFLDLKALYDNYNIFNSENFKSVTTIGNESYNALFYPALVFEMAAEAILVIFIMMIAYYCIKVDKKFKTLSIIFILSALLLQGIDLILMSLIQNGFEEPIFDDIYTQFTRAFYYTIIWLPYILLSKRIKNTYVLKVNMVTSKSSNSSFKDKIMTGISIFVGATLAISYYILGAIIYFWSAFLGYEAHGIFGVLATLFLPFFAQVYWIIHEWAIHGWDSLYVVFSLVTVGFWIIFLGISGLTERK